MSVDGVAFPDSRDAFAGEPLVVSGRLSRAIVAKGADAGSEGVPGVAVALLRGRSVESPGAFTPTGLTTTTDAAGRWSFRLTPPPPDITLVADAPAVGATSIVVQVTSSLRMTLAATGAALAGTVAPAQPGRTVELQRLLADARGRLNGRQVCGGAPTAINCSDAAWTTVGRAPLDASGTAYSAQAPGPGLYRARLSTEPDRAGRATAYGGVSPAARVGG